MVTAAFRKLNRQWKSFQGSTKGGLSNTIKLITHPLQWQVAKDLAGITNGWILPDLDTKNWIKVMLDTISVIPRKGSNIQPNETPTALVTWYRVKFTLPDSADQSTWLARINASGNGYLWLNVKNWPLLGGGTAA